MSRRSDYFSTMLGSSFQEGSSVPGDMLEIQVTDVEAAVLHAALHWVYTDRVDADMPAQQLLQVKPPPPFPPLHPPFTPNPVPRSVVTSNDRRICNICPS